MTTAACVRLIRDHFKTLVVEAIPGVTYVGENMRAEIPDDEVWTRVYVTGTSRQASTGSLNPRYRFEGTAFLQVFTPIEKGDSVSLDLQDKMEAKLQGKQIDDVIYRAVTRIYNGFTPDGGRWQITYTAAVHRDYYKTPQTLSDVGGIASTEVFGSPSVAHIVTSGIISSEIFGTPIVATV